MSEETNKKLSMFGKMVFAFLLLIFGGVYLHFSFAEESYEYLQIISIKFTPADVKISIGYPDGFTNRLDIFTSVDSESSLWELEGTFPVNLSSNRVEWRDVFFGDHQRRFYRVGNSDIDSDADSLADAQEKCVYGTAIDNPDTDHDEIRDGFEVLMGSDPLNPTDLTDLTDDSDSDGMPDYWEDFYFGGATNAVPENDEEPDGWSNLQEYLRGGNPTNSWCFDTNNVLRLEVKTPLRK